MGNILEYFCLHFYNGLKVHTLSAKVRCFYFRLRTMKVKKFLKKETYYKKFHVLQRNIIVDRYTGI